MPFDIFVFLGTRAQNASLNWTTYIFKERREEKKRLVLHTFLLSDKCATKQINRWKTEAATGTKRWYCKQMQKQMLNAQCSCTRLWIFTRKSLCQIVCTEWIQLDFKVGNQRALCFSFALRVDFYLTKRFCRLFFSFLRNWRSPVWKRTTFWQIRNFEIDWHCKKFQELLILHQFRREIDFRWYFDKAQQLFYTFTILSNKQLKQQIEGTQSTTLFSPREKRQNLWSSWIQFRT